MKKLIISFFAIVASISFALADDSGTCGDNLLWYYNSTTYELTITGSGKMYNYDDNNNLPPWHSYKENIMSLEFPQGLTSIGDSAFCGCSMLNEVTIPENIERIGNYAFWNCSNLNHVTLLTQTPPKICQYTFQPELRIYVPCGTLEQYPTMSNVMSVSQMLSMQAPDKDAGTTAYWVEGYIVGYYNFTTDPKFFIGTEGAQDTQIIIAENPDLAQDAISTSTGQMANIMAVKLETGIFKTRLNLKDNPANYKKKVKIHGVFEMYCGVKGLVSLDHVLLDGVYIPVPGFDPDYIPASTEKSIAEVNAAADSEDVFYTITGQITEIVGAEYGTLTLKDATGSIYVYGITSSYIGMGNNSGIRNDKSFATLNLVVGDIIKITGTKTTYNNAPEFLNAFFVEKVGHEDIVQEELSDDDIVVEYDFEDGLGDFMPKSTTEDPTPTNATASIVEVAGGHAVQINGDGSGSNMRLHTNVIILGAGTYMLVVDAKAAIDNAKIRMGYTLMKSDGTYEYKYTLNATELVGGDDFVELRGTEFTIAAETDVTLFISNNGKTGNSIICDNFRLYDVTLMEQNETSETTGQINPIETPSANVTPNSSITYYSSCYFILLNVQYTSEYLSVMVNNNGNVSYTPFSSCEPNTTITVTPDFGYEFIQWNDGNTDNPRIVTITQDTSFTAEIAIMRTGRCGNDNALTWIYTPETFTLTISGNGQLNANYTYGVEAPESMQHLVIADGVTDIGNSAFVNLTSITDVIWNIKQINDFESASTSPFYDIRTQLTSFVFGENVEKIPAYLCYGMSNLTNVSIPASVKSIGNNAFADCTGLENIYSYRTLPPNAYSTAFDGVDKFACVLHVLAGSINYYRNASAWRDFYYVEAIDAENVETTTMQVIPHEDNADVVWPAVDNATTYELTITDSNGNTVCTLTFNGNGQLTGISFHAPALRANHSNSGFRFNVTGLENGSSYNLVIKAKDSNGTVLQTFSQDFTTGATALENVNADGVSSIRKVIEDGKVVIVMPDGRKFDASGRKLR